MSFRSPLLLLLLSLCVSGLACSASRTPEPRKSVDSLETPALSAERLMEQGMASFRKGSFAAAISSWSDAAQLFEAADDPLEHGQALTRLSRAYQGIGQHEKALNTIERALLIARKEKNDRQAAEALGVQGDILTRLGESEKAYPTLHEALETATALGDPDLTARILNNLGNLLAAQKRFEEASIAYRESASTAREKGDTAAMALVNRASMSFNLGHYGEAKSWNDKAVLVLRSVEDSFYKTLAFVNAGILYRDLQAHFPGQETAFMVLASETFLEAIRISNQLSDFRTLSYAYGYLGGLYEGETRFEEALALTRGAISCAQRVDAPESLYRWFWQSGRILRRLGHEEEAIAAYRHALANLQAIRNAMNACPADADSSFQRTAASLCLQYADLLLERASSVEQPQAYLAEAREALELVKVLELRDYFKDDCVDAARYRETKLDLVSERALIIYPILLKDRLELLVRFPDSLRRYTVMVSSESLTQEVRAFRRKIEKRTTKEFLPHGQQLYDWLIRPFEKDLGAYPIDTLVFVPDGPLRTIPMAALHDGKEFLVQQYATAITPSLHLTDPRPLRRDHASALVLGLTESVQDFSSLPYVSDELKEILQLVGGRSLLNQDFVLTRVEEALRREPFTIVHIASHGHFGKDVGDAFLLAFDARLTMDRLGDYVGLFRFREEPLDLLTLSACETAAGDDRAALGLAGIAIRAGARSALATLWHVSDLASYRLVVEFYRQVRDPGVSRALALKAAQLVVLADPRYDHPCYWAPFLLLNNWL